jgi:hypothetical protein
MFEPQTIISVLAGRVAYRRPPYLQHRVYIDNGGDTVEKQVSIPNLPLSLSLSL